MPIEYAAYDKDGKRVTGVLELESPERAQEALWASNLVVLSLKKRGRRRTLAELIPTLFGIKLKDIIVFSRELASLLESGIALAPALRVLYEEEGKPALKQAIRSLMRDVETGKSFSQACAGLPSVFPPFYARLIQVAEETGELRKILLEIVVYLEKQRALVGKITKALTYPTIVLVVGFFGAFILVSFTLPSITRLLGEFGAKMPLTTRILVSISEIGATYGTRLLGAVTLLSVVGWQYFRTPSGKKRWDRIMLGIPVVGKIIHLSQMARLCTSMTTLLSGGIASAEAIRITMESTENSVFRESISEVYREVLTGSRLAPAVSRQRIFPRLFSQTVGIGEETGSLRTNLQGLSTFYEQETDRAAGRATDMIEPAIIILIGGIVGFVGVAIMSAIYGIIPQIK